MPRESASETDIPGFVSGIAKGKRLLGFDVGSKTIGLALSDLSLTIASPLETIRRVKFSRDVERISALVHSHDIGGFVLGMPLNMNGSEGPRAQSTRDFARNLTERLPLPLLFWDERLSTVAVTRTLVDADTSRRRQSELVDKLAAAYILQGFLDCLKQTAREP
jgi:putative Holliday junction resolvase